MILILISNHFTSDFTHHCLQLSTAEYVPDGSECMSQARSYNTPDTAVHNHMNK